MKARSLTMRFNKDVVRSASGSLALHVSSSSAQQHVFAKEESKHASDSSERETEPEGLPGMLESSPRKPQSKALRHKGTPKSEASNMNGTSCDSKNMLHPATTKKETSNTVSTSMPGMAIDDTTVTAAAASHSLKAIPSTTPRHAPDAAENVVNVNSKSMPMPPQTATESIARDSVGKARDKSMVERTQSSTEFIAHDSVGKSHDTPRPLVEKAVREVSVCGDDIDDSGSELSFAASDFDGVSSDESSDNRAQDKTVGARGDGMDVQQNESGTSVNTGNELNTNDRVSTTYLCADEGTSTEAEPAKNLKAVSEPKSSAGKFCFWLCRVCNSLLYVLFYGTADASDDGMLSKRRVEQVSVNTGNELNTNDQVSATELPTGEGESREAELVKDSNMVNEAKSSVGRFCF